jgi:nitroimidazol reductase NimA-like FMN-containing flavoprotein (pyridoxamine 5'-phosphate oxidase superfamily)
VSERPNPIISHALRTERTTVRRHSERGQYDRETIHRIIDEALICHVAIVQDGQPFVMPMIHTRIDDRLYIHGSRGSRMLLALAAGAPACLTMTIIDGLVLARSAMHHSINYRSAVVLGTGRAIEEERTKWLVWGALVEHVMPGRSRDCRMPNAKESAATMLVEIDMNEASAKIRNGGPKDDPDDLALPHWAGVLPLRMIVGAPIRDEAGMPDSTAPQNVIDYDRAPRSNPPR